MRSPVNFAPLPDSLRPGKGYHGEQTTFFGREACSNFSLLPVNLWLRRHSMREGGRAGGQLREQPASLAPPHAGFYLETRSCGWKHCPLCVEAGGGGKKLGERWEGGRLVGQEREDSHVRLSSRIFIFFTAFQVGSPLSPLTVVLPPQSLSFSWRR